ncbi:MAG: hypothetical protein ACK4SY_09730 [Pyrobaculum sp.]
MKVDFAAMWRKVGGDIIDLLAGRWRGEVVRMCYNRDAECAYYFGIYTYPPGESGDVGEDFLFVVTCGDYGDAFGLECVDKNKEFDRYYINGVKFLRNAFNVLSAGTGLTQEEVYHVVDHIASKNPRLAGEMLLQFMFNADYVIRRGGREVERYMQHFMEVARQLQSSKAN